MSENNNNEELMKTTSEPIEQKETEVVTPTVATSIPTQEAPVTLTPNVTQAELQLLDYTNFDTPARMMELGKVLAQSKLVPLNKPEDVFVALKTGQELGLPFIVSISQIYPINGKPTLGIHLKKALCIKAGIIYEKIEDAVDIYEFVKCNENGEVLTEVKIVNGQQVKVPIIEGYGTLEEQPANTRKKAVDKRTKYRIERDIKKPSGAWKTIVAYGSFSIGEAREAGLMDKENWQKYYRRMLDARALSIAINEVAPDVVGGLYMPNELSNDFYVDESGTERVLDITNN
jgi:hypothetical protein